MNRLVTTILSLAVFGGLLTPASALAGSRAKSTKVNVYVDLLNNHSRPVFDARRRYFESVNPAGITCKEKRLRAPGTLPSGLPRKLKDFGKALKKRPKMKKPDKAAKAMMAALGKMHKPMQELTNYVRRRAYKKDDCAKGKELHTKVVATWHKFAQAHGQLNNWVGEYNDKRTATALKKTRRKYGKRFRYHYNKILIETKKLVHATTDAVPNASEVPAKHAALSKTLASVQKKLDKAKGKTKAMLSRASYRFFVRRAKTFADRVDGTMKQDPADVKKYSRRIREANRAYNSMIDAANRVRFDRKLK